MYPPVRQQLPTSRSQNKSANGPNSPTNNGYNNAYYAGNVSSVATSVSMYSSVGSNSMNPVQISSGIGVEPFIPMNASLSDRSFR